MLLFGLMPEGGPDGGKEVLLARLENGAGMAVEILTLGGIVHRLWTPDRKGRLADVVLGHETPEACVAPGGCPGAIIGRCANRIGGAKFAIDGRVSRLEANNHGNCLHGGSGNYARRVFDVAHAGGRRLTLTLRDKGGVSWGGFPGALELTVEYTLSDDNGLTIRYAAVPEQPTVVNLTCHAYFNLAGHDGGSVRGHELQIDADFFTPTDDACLPHGEIRPVTGGPLDFRAAKTVGESLDELEREGCPYGGLDHNMVLKERGMKRAATLYDATSGRTLTVLTDQPGVQIYSANHLKGTSGKDGARYERHQALCLETQNFPNAINVAHFPDPVIKPGKNFSTSTTFQFGTSS